MANVDALPSDRATPFKQDLKGLVQTKVVQAASDRGILLVRTSDLPSDGLLSVRQRGWVNSAPYDARTENPVLYKHAIESALPPRHVTEKNQEKQEVQSLPDVLRTPSTLSEVADSGGVGARLREGRKERHDAMVQDMKQELASISSEFETRVQDTADLLKTQLLDSDKAIASIFERASTPELLGSMTLTDLHAMWDELARQTTVRQNHIKIMDSSLSAIEQDRSQSVGDVLRSYAVHLQAIAYLLPTDLQRLIEEDAQDVNMAMLANRRSYCQLCMHLMTADLTREREQHEQWESILSDWSDLVCQSTLVHFQYFLSSGHIQDPPHLQRLRDNLAAEQKSINKRRLGILRRITSLAPPKATKSLVYEWRESIRKLHQQLESVHTGYLLQFQSCYEAVSRSCEDEMEKCREQLVSSGAFDSSTVHKVLNRLFLPLVESQSVRMREDLQNVEKSMDSLLSSQQSQFDTLFTYCQGAASLWDESTHTTSSTDKAFQERLDECRTVHDRGNQNLEANLDILLDRLRQGATQEVLGQHLQEAMRMLDTIKEGYGSFHSGLLEEVNAYPGLVKRDLDCYDSAICKYLGASRSPLKKSKSKLTISRAPSEISRTESRTKTKRSKPVRSKTTASNLAAPTSGRASSVAPGSHSSMSVIGEEVIHTSGGTTFYIQRNRPKTVDEATFLTQDEESEGSSQTLVTENIAIPQEVFDKAQEGLCVTFLEQLEKWRVEMMDRAHMSVAGKEEELNTELDLRLHLHEPRPSRIEQDIHNVRVTELLAHRDRRNTGETLAEILKIEADKFSVEIESLDKDLLSCSKSKELFKVYTKAEQKLQKHMQQVSNTSREYLDMCEGVLGELSDSNESYRTSIKLFSDGGNYCPEESELFTKRLVKLAGKITSTLTHIRTEISTLTQDRIAADQETMDNFKAVFNLHVADLSFLDGISRTLTSAQVRIKSEVAGSNTQSRKIKDSISNLKSQVGEESVQSSAILSCLPDLFELLNERTDYLYCRSSQLRGARVGGQIGVNPSSSSHATKPIGAMNVTRSILEHSSATRRHSDSNELKVGERKQSTVATPTGPATGPVTTEPRLSVYGPPPTGLATTESRLSVHGDDQQRRQSRRKTVAYVERKNISFGIGGGDSPSKAFLPKIRTILKSVHLELYHSCEEYYRSKGVRPPTRPDDIEDSFEGCMDALINKSHGYRSQAEEYRNNCIEEFHDQLLTLISVLECVPGLVTSDLIHQWREKGERDIALKEHTTVMEGHTSQRGTHKSSLRPSLGHPSQTTELEALCRNEEARHKDCVAHIHSYSEQMREKECGLMQGFMAALKETVKSLLALFDTVTSPKDIIPGGDKANVKRPMEDLLRDHLTQAPSPSSNTHTPATVGKVVWPGLPERELEQVYTVLPPVAAVTRGPLTSSGRRVSSPSSKQLADKDQTNDKLVSKKTTTAHQAVIQQRDSVFKDYCNQFHQRLTKIEKREHEERSSEVKWVENWTHSVDKVKQLYS